MRFFDPKTEKNDNLRRNDENEKRPPILWNKSEIHYRDDARHQGGNYIEIIFSFLENGVEH